jgi:hypothetical protein
MWAGVDDLFAIGVGVLIGAGVSVITQELTTGTIDPYKVGIDAAAGAIGGEVSLYAGPLVGGAAAGFVDNAATQIYQHHGLANFNVGELAFDTVAGAVLGKFGDYLFNGIGASNPATWGSAGFRAAMACVKFGGGDLTIGGLSSVFGAPLGGVLAAGYG